jgi:hypothetical protein
MGGIVKPGSLVCSSPDNCFPDLSGFATRLLLQRGLTHLPIDGVRKWYQVTHMARL